MKQYEDYLPYGTSEDILARFVDDGPGALEYYQIETTGDYLTDLQHQAIRYLALATRNRDIGDMKKALAYTDSLRENESLIFKDVIQRNVSRVQRDYLTRKVELKKHEADRLHWLIYLGAVVSGCIVLIIALVARFRVRTELAERERKIAELLLMSKTMQSEIEERERKVVAMGGIIADEYENRRQLQVDMEKLFKERWATLNLICGEYMADGTRENVKKALLQRIERELYKMSQPSTMRQLQSLLNEYMDGVIDKLRSEFPRMNESDVALFTLLYAGISPKAVSLILEMTVKNVYAKRSRFLAKLSEREDETAMFLHGKLAK